MRGSGYEGAGIAECPWPRQERSRVPDATRTRPMQGQIAIKLFCYCTFSRQWVLAGGSLFSFFTLSNSEFSFSFISIMNKNVTSRPWKSMLRLVGTANPCANAGTSWTRQVEVFLPLLRSSTVTLRARWVSCNWISCIPKKFWAGLVERHDRS